MAAIPKEKKKAIKSYFQDLKSAAQSVFLPSIEKAVSEKELSSYLYSNLQDAKNALWSRIEGTNLIYTYYGEHFKDFLRENCFDEIVFWFGKELNTEMSGSIPGEHLHSKLAGVFEDLELMESQTPQSIEGSESASSLQEVLSVPIHPTGIYTYKEAAALSKCSYVTIWRAVANGKLKATSVGNQPRVIGSKLLEWIEAGGETGRSKATM